MHEQRLGAACVVYAHLAYLYRNRLEAKLDRRAVATLLTAQIFLNIHCKYSSEPDPPPPVGLDGKDERVRCGTKRSELSIERHEVGLSIPEIELCDIFACHRGRIIRWLDNASPFLRASVLEAIVRTVTFTSRQEANDEAGPLLAPTKSNGVAALPLIPRSWNGVALPGYAGRYMPDTEAPQLVRAAQPLTDEPFERWLRRVTTTAVDTEVNAQLGEFTLKKHTVRALDDRLRRLPDLVDVLGPPTTEKCAPAYPARAPPLA